MPEELPFPDRRDAVLEGFAMYAASQERTLADIAKAFASRGEKGGS